MLFGSFANSKAFPLMAFLTPLVVRIIPEILMGPFVVGFDTLAYYVPNTLLWLRNGVGLWDFMAVAPFFYVLLMGVTSIGVPIVLSLKVMSPLLLGFLGLALTKPLKATNLLWLPFVYAYWSVQCFLALYAVIQIVLKRPRRWVKTSKNGVVSNRALKMGVALGRDF
jgi:hypothetical protein